MPPYLFVADKDFKIEILLICWGSMYDGKSVWSEPSISKIAYAWLLIDRLPPLIRIFGLPFATLSPITLIPGNFPTITSNRVVAAGEIVKLAEGLDKLLFWVPHEQKTINKIIFNNILTDYEIANLVPLLNII